MQAVSDETDIRMHLRELGLADDDLVAHAVACEQRERTPEENAMHIQCGRGDLTIYWSRRNRREVEYARNAFDAARRAGNLIYKRSPGSDRGEVVNRFDEDLEGMEIVVTKPMAGG